MNIAKIELFRATTHSPEYIIFCLIIFLLIALLTLISQNRTTQNSSGKKKNYSSQTVAPNTLIINEGYDRRREKPITSLQDLFTIDLAKIPDDSFQFIADIDLAKSFFVHASKRLGYKEAELFDNINVNVFKDGSLNVQFYGSVYDHKKHENLINFLSAIYKVYGEDSEGKTTLSESGIFKLRRYSPLPTTIKWKNGTVSLTFGRDVNFSFPYVSNNRQSILSSYYLPYIKVTKNGILQSHEQVLNATEASMLLDDFTKKKSIMITKVAGVANEKYIYTYTLHDNFITNLFNLTKLGLSFSYSNRFFFLHLISFDKDFQLAKGDNIIFLFHDDTTLTVTCAASKAVDSSGTYRNVAHLNYNDMKAFATKRLVKWKMTSIRKAVFQVGGPVNNMHITQYQGEEEGQYLLQVIAKRLIQCVILNEGNSFNETSPELLGPISE